MPASNGFPELWRQADSLEQQGLFKSAAELARQIELKADAENNMPESVKAVIYRAKYATLLEEDGLIKAIQLFETELAGAPQPKKAILQSRLAKLYAVYLQNNGWSLNDRTPLADGEKGDVLTWSAAQIEREIQRLYLASLQPADALRTISSTQMGDLVTPGIADSVGGYPLRPTLYDVMAHEAARHFADERSFLSEPVYAFVLNQPEAFAQPVEFARFNFATADTTSGKWLAIRLFQDLTKHHDLPLVNQAPDQGKTAALIDLTLIRLRFAKDNSTLEQADSLYAAALETLHRRFIKHPSAAEIRYEQAQHLLQRNDQTDKTLKQRAYALCEDAVKSHPGTYGAKLCQIKMDELKAIQVEVSIEKYGLPGRPQLVRLSYANLSKIWLKVVKIPGVPMEFSSYEQYNSTAKFVRLPAVQNKTWTLEDKGDYERHGAELAVDPLERGVYGVVVSNSPDFESPESHVSASMFYISQLAAVQIYNQNELQLAVVDRASGAPLPNVQVRLYGHFWERNNQQKRAILSPVNTGADGLARFVDFAENGGRQVSALMTHGGDSLWMENLYAYMNNESFEVHQAVRLFTDRSLYRPGQSVYFKGILLQYDEKGRPKIVQNQPVTIRLRDANYQEKDVLELRSNEYGSFNGVFTAPTGGLTGGMTLSADGLGDAYIQVEEYKRPKFEVEFEPVKGAYQLGDQVTVTAKATTYSGAVVDGAEVKYRVHRSVRLPYAFQFSMWKQIDWPWLYGDREIAFGTVVTDANGKADITFKAVADQAADRRFQPVFQYTVYADVTDQAGETRSQTTLIPVGYSALEAKLGLGATVESGELDSVSLQVVNLGGMPVDAQGVVTLRKLDAPSTFFKERFWDAPDVWPLSEAVYRKDFPDYAYKNEDDPKNWAKSDVVIPIEFDTRNAKSLNFNAVKKIEPGYYLVKLETRDVFGRPFVSEQMAYVWSKNKPASRSHKPEAQAEKNVWRPDETAVVSLSAQLGPLHLLYAPLRRQQAFSAKWLQFDGSSSFTIPLTADDQGDLYVNMFTIKNNRLYQGDVQLAVPFADKDLKIQFETFRDKLTPGQKETWRIRVSGAKKDKFAAEMLASMYDASLDQFLPHTWDFSIYPTNYKSSDFHAHGVFGLSGWNTSSGPVGGYTFSDLPNRTYGAFNWFGFPFYEGRMGRPMPMMAMRSKMEDSADIAMESAPVMAGEEKVAGGQAPPPPPPPAPAEATGEAPIRKNLDETVFFFPQLTTDANGDVILNFTMKEALTRWKLQLFAHTKDLAYGLAEKTVVTQKDLMITANPPRFFRAGDEMEFSAKIANLTPKTLAGKATLSLFDAENMQPLDGRFGLQKPAVDFNAPAAQSTAAMWRIRIPEDYTGAVTWRVVADAGTVKDGEESSLPVVTNRILVTETLPMTVRGKQTRTFRFDAPATDKKRVNHRFTLEMTGNPVWYAVQSLPYLMEYPHECSEQVFSRYYANTLAAHVTGKLPRIRRVYDTWKQTGSTALQSNLNKNQELKNALLEETPWVLEAQDEARQKQNIALLFDLNTMANQQERALNTLIERQSANGGWPWFPGGRESWSITQHILVGMLHLERLGAIRFEDNPALMQTLERAETFCRQEAEKHYKDIEQAVQKGHTKWEDDHLDPLIVQYLYAASFYDKFPDDRATRYFIQQGQTHWLKKGLYEQGLLTLVFHRTKNEYAARLLNSLLERSTTTDELGMYWPNQWGAYWYQLPIETQALMIEVFSEVAPDPDNLENLRIWLLKNKQTNRWESTKATTEAVYALLLHGDNWLAESQPAQVQIGAQRIEAKDTEPGTGYFKQAWTGGQAPDLSKGVKVDNPNSHPVWGAAYWQYFTDLDAVQGFDKTGIKIKRTLWAERNTPAGPALTAITDQTPIRVGDKVKVRIEIVADRAMEFVHLKDLRAAGFEPRNVLSGYQWQGGLGYYQSTRDLATHFFFDYLPKGTYVLEYAVSATHRGAYSNGIATLQCMYAPEFSSHSTGGTTKIE